MKKLVLIRHAERPEIKSTSVGNEVMLTDKGKQETLEYATKINQPVLSIRTSPIGRCVQTAEIIAAHSGYPLENIESTTQLGDPGFIISDGEQAWNQWQTKGIDEVNEILLSGSETLSGFVDLTHAINIFKSEVRDLLINSKEGIHFWVTHDVIVATVASRVSEQPLSLMDWPHFLGNLEISLSNSNELIFQYNQ